MSKVCKCVANLGVEGMKALLSHVKGITDEFLEFTCITQRQQTENELYDSMYWYIHVYTWYEKVHTNTYEQYHITVGRHSNI